MLPGSFTKHLKSQLLPLPCSKWDLAQPWCLPAGHSPALTSGRSVWTAPCFSKTSLPILRCLCIRLTCWALCFKIKNLGHFTSMKSSSQTEPWLVKESFYFFSVNVTTFPGYSVKIFNDEAGWNFFKGEGYFTMGTKIILFSWTYFFFAKTIENELTKMSVLGVFQMCFYKFNPSTVLPRKKIKQDKTTTNKTPKKPETKQKPKKLQIENNLSIKTAFFPCSNECLCSFSFSFSERSQTILARREGSWNSICGGFFSHLQCVLDGVWLWCKSAPSLPKVWIRGRLSQDL